MIPRVWGTLGLTLALATMSVAQELPKADPLQEISGEMRGVVKQLNKQVTGKPTQESQKEIVNRLDLLIAELEKECAACKGKASGNRPTKPASDSVIIGGTGGIGDLHSAKNGGKKWGELPAKDRDRILQSLTEGFPAHYQTILERYYRRLAEEKSPSEKDAKPKAKDEQAKPEAKATRS